MALLKFKRSAVPAKVPSIADLDLGELAINTYDGKVYTKKDDGTQAIVEVGGGGGVQTITSSDGSVTVTGTTNINLSVATAAATNTVLLPVRNNTGATLAKGTAVYINGALGQNPTVTKAIATGDATSAQTLGLVTANIANNAVGNVTLIGTLTNLDTSAYSDGQQLYLSPTTAGALTATKPYAPSHLVYMAVVEHAHPSQGKLFVKVQNGYEMDELHDVSARNPANNDGLFYNTSTNLWEKKSIATALGYTPANKAGDTFTGLVTVSGTGLSAAVRLSNTSGGRDWRVMQKDDGRFVITDETAGAERLAITSGGAVTALTDIRAPIFYDSNNTGYFLDPAGSSNLLSVQINGTLDVRDSNAQFWRSTNGAYQRVDTRTDATSFSRAHWYGVSSSGGTSNFRHAWYDNATYFYVTAQDGEIIFNREAGETIVRSTGSFRAPIFYDSNNTAYYVDPNSGGLALRTSGYWIADSTAWAGDINGKIQYHDNSWYISAANQWVFRASSGAEPFRVTQGGIAIASADMRAPIFYDNNNTGYYLDPNGRSNLSNITVASGGTESGIRFRGDTLDFVGRYSNYVSLFNANGPEFKLFDSGYAYLGHYAENGASWRAPIFYDTNDTGRYLDPNSTSSLYRLSSYIAAQDANANWNTGFQNTPASSYNYHGDLNGGTNAPAAGWWFYESMRHSNASNFWGTQIAWGWEDNANRMLQRNVTGNSFGGWVEYLNTSGRTYNGNLNMTGSIISTASDVRAPIFYDQNDTSTFINPNGESWIKGDFKLSRVAAGGDNDCFGGLELREVSLVGAAQSAATYAPRLNFHWGSRAAATIYMDAGGSFVFGGQGNITSNRRSIFCNELYATGNVTAYYSDDRLKTRIGNIENALDIVSSLNGFRYVDNDLAKTFGYANENGQIGVSAQEVQKHLPEIVRPAAFDVNHDNPDHGSKSGENYLTVDYSRLVPLLIEAIKELRDEVEALKNRS